MQLFLRFSYLIVVKLHTFASLLSTGQLKQYPRNCGYWVAESTNVLGRGHFNSCGRRGLKRVPEECEGYAAESD